jgi:hypothetical protein
VWERVPWHRFASRLRKPLCGCGGPAGGRIPELADLKPPMTLPGSPLVEFTAAGGEVFYRRTGRMFMSANAVWGELQVPRSLPRVGDAAKWIATGPWRVIGPNPVLGAQRLSPSGASSVRSGLYPLPTCVDWPEKHIAFGDDGVAYSDAPAGRFNHVIGPRRG